MSEISKKNLEHLADLARIELKGEEKDKFLKDLDSILNYFHELQEVDTENVPAMAGGTELKNVLRADDKNRDKTKETGNAVRSFPEEERGYLKTPPVFE